MNDGTPTHPTSKFPIATKLILWLAVALIIASIVFNIQFFSGFGTGFSSLTFAIVGVLLDLSKIVMINLFSFFFVHRAQWAKQAYTCLGVWILLTILSLAAGYGFLSLITEQFEAKRLKASNQYQQGAAAVENAQKRLDSLAQYANVDSNVVGQQLVQLNSALDEEKVTLSNCRPNYITHCIKPAKARIAALQSQIMPLETKLAGAKNYEAALAAKEAATAGFNKIGSVSTAVVHPLFSNASHLFGYSPFTLKGAFLLGFSIVTELLSSVLFYLYVFIQIDVFNTRVGNVVIVDKAAAKNNAPKLVYSRIEPGPVAITHDVPAVAETPPVTTSSPQTQALQVTAVPLVEHFQTATKLVANGVIKPSKYGLQKWSKEVLGGLLADGTIREWQAEWLRRGLIEAGVAQNGKATYYLATNK